MYNGNWYDAMRQCKSSKAHLWTPSSHAEWWNIYNLIGSSEWKYAMEADTSNFIFLTTILYIGFQSLDDVSMLKYYVELGKSIVHFCIKDKNHRKISPSNTLSSCICIQLFKPSLP